MNVIVLEKPINVDGVIWPAGRHELSDTRWVAAIRCAVERDAAAKQEAERQAKAALDAEAEAQTK